MPKFNNIGIGLARRIDFLLMNEAHLSRKGFRGVAATLQSLALILPLGLSAPLAFAQYIPPPAAQTFAPTQGAATGTAGEAEATTRGSRRSRARHKITRPTAEAIDAESVAEPSRPQRSTRRSRAAARAEARAARSATPDTPAETPAPLSEVTLLAGEAQTTNARGAQDIAGLLAQSGFVIKLQSGKISLAQLADPDSQSQADLASLQSDVLEDARREGGPDITRKVAYIARLYNQEIHIVARGDVTQFADLATRTVAVGGPDTPEGRTATTFFARAGLKPTLAVMDQKTALERLGRGQIDAALFIGGKPAPALANSLAELAGAGLHLLAIPYKGALQEFYYPAQIKGADYPGLVTAGAPVDTIAIGTVLVALDARPGSPRYKALTQFTEVFFGKFGALREGSHHPKWREVNLAADVPGWRRFMPAQKWLDRAPAPRLSSVK